MDGNLVHYDETTKCHSRYYYDNIVKDKYRDRLCYVVYIDINGLKETNDKYGHHYGTKLIKQVASNLLSIKGAKDICSRHRSHHTNRPAHCAFQRNHKCR